MADRQNRIEPKLPRGFADRAPEDIRAVERMMEKIKAVYERYGFEPGETPFVEYTEALGKFLPDQDRPNEGVFSFQDDDEAWLSLRYDLTAPLARYVAQNFDRLPKPYRSYRAGWVFRNEKPGPGRFRQFMQFDADTVGSKEPAADAEIAMMAADAMEAVGFQRGQYVIKVNNRKVLDGVMEAVGLEGEKNTGRRLTVLRAIDKLDRLGIDGVRQLLGKGRTDETGDFTKGADLSVDQIDKLLSMFDLDAAWSYAAESFDDDPDVVRERSIEALKTPRFVDEVTSEQFPGMYLDNASIAQMFQQLSLQGPGMEGIEELVDIADSIRASGYGSRRIRIDPSVVRGLEYYTGAVFEAQLTFEVPNEKGEPVVFGSVGGGGRYDGLVGRFRGENVPATGFSVGVSRLATALKAIGKLDDLGAHGPVVVTVMDRARLADYQKIVADLRNAGVAAEMYLGSSGMKAQLKYADRRNSPAAIIAGSQEFDAGKLQIKDLAAGKAQASSTADHQAWRDERPGQFEVPRADVVTEVQKLLQRQRLG
jgi:histidyl-tRNA synthetase